MAITAAHALLAAFRCVTAGASPMGANGRKVQTLPLTLALTLALEKKGEGAGEGQGEERPVFSGAFSH